MEIINGPNDLSREIKKFYNNKSILRKKYLIFFKFNISNHKRKFETIINNFL